MELVIGNYLTGDLARQKADLSSRQKKRRKLQVSSYDQRTHRERLDAKNRESCDCWISRSPHKPPVYAIRACRKCNPALIQLSSSAESRLCQELSWALDNLHLRRSWYAFLPARLVAGQAPSSAARAIIKAHQYRFLGDPNLYMESVRYHARAVTDLRNSLDVSDESLMTVGMLMLYEDITRMEHRNWNMHQQAIVDLLLARPKGYPMTDFTRSMIYSIWDRRRQPSEMGSPSTFEESRWMDLEPVWATSVLPARIVKLRKLAHQMMIRIPRLTAYVREIRSCDTDDTSDVFESIIEEAVAFGQHMLMLEDKEGDNAILHRVRVVRTNDTRDRRIIPYSFDFESLDEMDTAILYWTYRLRVSQLCLQINLAISRQDPNSILPFLTADLEDVSIRTATNLLMGSEYISAHGIILNRVISNIYFIVYETFKNLETFHGEPIAVVRTWLLEKFRNCTAGWPIVIDHKGMEETGDLVSILLDITLAMPET